jgi:hypothetical protein
MNYLAAFQIRRLGEAWTARFRQFKINGFVWASPRQMADETVVIDEIEIRCEKTFTRVNPRGKSLVGGWRSRWCRKGERGEQSLRANRRHTIELQVHAHDTERLRRLLYCFVHWRTRFC